MTREYTIYTEKTNKEKAYIDICKYCDLPVSKCNGDCDRYRQKAKELKKTKILTKQVFVF